MIVLPRPLQLRQSAAWTANSDRKKGRRHLLGGLSALLLSHHVKSAGETVGTKTPATVAGV